MKIKDNAITVQIIGNSTGLNPHALNSNFLPNICIHFK